MGTFARNELKGYSPRHLGNQIFNKNKIKFGLHSQMFGCDRIICSEIPFSKSSCLIETSHLICKVNQ